jgi:hypothetical protein
MKSTRWFNHALLAILLTGTLPQVQAGPPPGYASPWNGPWGGGYLNGESYNPLMNPYVGAGYPIAGPYSNGNGIAAADGGQPMNMPPQQVQPRQLPGGGYLLPPSAGGGMMPGAYANHRDNH